MNKYARYQRKILRLIKKNPNKIIITAEQGLGKINIVKS
jgi:hypothetical protein